MKKGPAARPGVSSKRSAHLDREPTLQRKVAFLRRPDSYPDGPKQVQTVETHMSWVFLTDRFACKLKKPVRLDFLDFSTLEARRRDCGEEVRLNRRLAPHVYLGMIPLTVSSDGALQLDGEGVIVDWLVQMNRLPSGRMLDRVIAEGRVDEDDVGNVASYLARFYSNLSPVETSPSAFVGRFEDEVQAQRRELAKPEYGMPDGLVRSIALAQARFLQDGFELFRERVRQRRIIEGHGDLRPEHICLGDPPAVIDCLEFNRDFRILDPAEELCFLWMECEFLGAPEVGERFWETYARMSGDRPPDLLLDFYKCHRACLRAKLSLWHLFDPDIDEPGKWRSRARQYLQLAERYAKALGREARPPERQA